MPTYDHLCKSCKHEWEDIYSIKAPVPTMCPSCNQEGHVERLISGGSGRGIVELTGADLKDHIKSEAARIKSEASRSEKVYGSLLGEERMHSLQTKLDRRGR